MIQAKVQAYNEIGQGPESDPNTIGALVASVPLKPTSTPQMISQSPTSISVSMPEITGLLTGGSVILSYNLQFKDSLSTNYVTLTGEAPDNMLLTYTRNGLTANRVYQFKYRVRNKYGWGPFSDSTSIRAA